MLKHNSKAHPFALLSNKILSRLLSKDQLAQLFAHFLAACDEVALPKELERLLSYNHIQKILNGFSCRIEDFGTRPIYRISNAPNRTLTLAESIIKFHSDDINKFTALRRDFEELLICGKYDEAERILQCIVITLGESIWYVRNKILLLGLQGKYNEMQKYTDECKKRTKFGLLTFVFSYIFLISHSRQALLHLNQLVIRNVNEFMRAGHDEYASLLSLMFVPVPLAGHYNQVASFSMIQSFSVVDQYCLLLNWIPIAVAETEKNKTNELTRDDIKCFVSRLKEKIDCHHLDSISAYFIEDNDFLNISEEDELVSLYERGDYEDLLYRYDEKVRAGCNPFLHVNLAAKASALLRKKPAIFEGSPLCEFMRLLTDIYSLAYPQSRIVEDIESIAIRLNGLSHGLNIQLAIYKALPNLYSRNDSRYLAKLAEIATRGITPLACKMATGSSVFFDGSYSQATGSRLPPHRASKQKIRNLIKTGGPKELIEQELSSFSEISPLKKDVNELVVNYYLSEREYNRAISIAAYTLAESSNCYTTLPLNELVETIEREKLNTLDSVIVLYYFVALISRKSEYLLNETFEDYLLSQEIDRPSQLLGEKEALDPREKVFFSKICSSEIMDFLGCFTSADELLEERLRIVYRLKEMKVISEEDAGREIDEIVGRFVIDSSAEEFNSRKVYVNDTSIKKSRSSDIESLFELYRFSTDQEEKQYLLFEEAKSQTGIDKALLAGDKSNTLLKIINSLMMSFLFDPKYGLDQNLSTEIRHGFFSNLMRSRPDARKLLCEVDVNGEYKSNSHWLDENSILAQDILYKVDEELKIFSAEFNGLIDKSNEWMKIRLNDGADSAGRVFDFSVYKIDFEKARSLADSTSSHEEFIDGYIELLWKKTEHGLSIMRDNINGRFRESLDKIFDSLLERIYLAKRGAALHELTSAIIQTKSDMREDITTASNWFRRAESHESQRLLIRNLIGIAVRCFEMTKGTTDKIRYEFAPELDCFYIEGGGVKPFIISLINTLDNCFKHSGYGNNTLVDIRGTLSDDGCVISVSNDVSPERCQAYSPEFIKETSERMRSPSSIGLMRLEGGTGFCKIYNSLKKASPKFDVDISFTPPKFVTLISYAARNTSS